MLEILGVLTGITFVIAMFAMGLVMILMMFSDRYTEFWMKLGGAAMGACFIFGTFWFVGSALVDMGYL